MLSRKSRGSSATRLRKHVLPAKDPVSWLFLRCEPCTPSAFEFHASSLDVLQMLVLWDRRGGCGAPKVTFETTEHCNWHSHSRFLRLRIRQPRAHKATQHAARNVQPVGWLAANL